MNEIETHINKLFENVTDSKRKRELMQEIIQNLNEKVNDLVNKGQTREGAVQKAIEDFGDIDDLRTELESSGKLSKSKNAGLSLAFSIWGALLIIGLFLFINLYYTPTMIWFAFPVFAVLWWPMAMFFRWVHLKKDVPVGLPFSICSFLLIVGLLLFINFYYTPEFIWFVYPTFAALWWPLAMLFHTLREKNKKEEMIDD
jgi:hypothetical protein